MKRIAIAIPILVATCCVPALGAAAMALSQQRPLTFICHMGFNFHN